MHACCVEVANISTRGHQARMVPSGLVLWGARWGTWMSMLLILAVVVLYMYLPSFDKPLDLWIWKLDDFYRFLWWTNKQDHPLLEAFPQELLPQLCTVPRWGYRLVSCSMLMFHKLMCPFSAYDLIRRSLSQQSLVKPTLKHHVKLHNQHSPHALLELQGAVSYGTHHLWFKKIRLFMFCTL